MSVNMTEMPGIELVRRHPNNRIKWRIMNPLATLAAGMATAAATLGVAATAHAGGPPGGGDGGGGGAAAAPSQCSDADLTVTNGAAESANTLRRVVVSFRNTSSHPCGLVGYPDANLVTAAGGVLVHVEPRPALAAHVLTLAPNDVANADVQAYAIDTATGNPCGREGTLVVTPPRGSVSHTLPVSLPICNATISSVD
jgi:hypothetical protein